MFRDNAARSAGLAANEEGVWLSDQDSIVRLGQEDAVWEPKPGNHTPSFRVAPDGTLYRPFEERVLVDGEWRLQRPDVNGIDLKQRGSMLMAPDGTLWGIDWPKGELINFDGTIPTVHTPPFGTEADGPSAADN